MNNCENIKTCRLCDSKNIRVILPFGESPLANSYPQTIDEKEELYNLTLMKCSECNHIQLRETILPEKLFSNYLYASSDSPALVRHFKEFASDIQNRFDYGKEITILEIGSNDGVLLREFENINFGKLIGVEPAKNIAEISQQRTNATIINDFFNEESAEKIKNKFGPINIICANNVFAHVSDINSLMKGIVHCLDKNGVFVFENAYLLDTIKGLYFDQVYHEHLQYYGIIPLVQFFKKYNMEIFDIKRVDVQGGSFRIFVKHNESLVNKTTENVQEFINKELEYNLYSDYTFETFIQKLNDLKNELSSAIKRIRDEDKTISCYGCPAKFALFTKFFDLDNNIVKYVVDDSKLKQGRFSPGKRIPIVSRDYFYKNPTDYCIISAWNMADPIIKNNQEYKGKFIIPMPFFKII